ARPAELAADSDTTDADCSVGAPKTLHRNVAGIDETQSADVSIGPSARVSVLARLGLDFTVGGVANGPQHLVAIRTTHSTLPARLILRRDVDLPDGANIPLLDFGSAEAFDLVTANVTAANVRGMPAVNVSELVTGRGEFALPFA